MTLAKSLLRLLGRQEYIRLGIRDRIIRACHNPDTAKSEEFAVPFFGSTYKGNLNSYLDWTVFYYGAHEREDLRLIQEILEPVAEPVAFDVGANVGHHALFAARFTERLYAFEPFEGVSEKMVEKLTDNHITNVEVCKFGLGENNSLEDYTPPDKINPGTGNFLGNGSVGHTPLKLQIRKGDDIVEEKHLDRLDFIKMDVEGFEPFALKGLERTLAELRPVVFFEWTPSSRHEGASATASTLFPKDYLFYDVIGHTLAFKLFRQPTYRLVRLRDGWVNSDLPGFTNLLAVPKEYLEKVNALSPLPAIARRLNAA